MHDYIRRDPKKPAPTRRQAVAVPHPMADVTSLHATVMALKEAVEVLQTHRGDVLDGAITWRDLVAIGLITADQVPQPPPSGRLR